jgi:hypothetical protein
LKTIQEKKMNEAKIGNDLEHHLVLYKQTRDWFCLFLQQELSDIVLVLVDTITQEVRTRLEDLMNVWSSNQWINFKKSVYILHFVESGTSESQFQVRVVLSLYLSLSLSLASSLRVIFLNFSFLLHFISFNIELKSINCCFFQIIL